MRCPCSRLPIHRNNSRGAHILGNFCLFWAVNRVFLSKLALGYLHSILHGSNGRVLVTFSKQISKSKDFFRWLISVAPNTESETNNEKGRDQVATENKASDDREGVTGGGCEFLNNK